jgi:multidrug efflux system membrane fusion protein
LNKTHRNYLIAAIAAVVIGAWLASGVIIRSTGEPAKTDPGDDQAEIFTVAVEERAAEEIRRSITLQGETVPERSVRVRAQTGGRLEAVPVNVGDRVEDGALLARVAMDDRQARLREAQANLRQKRQTFEAQRRLEEQGHQSALNLESARAALESARAAVERIETDIARTKINAPFAGIIDHQHVNQGDLVSPGTAVVTLVDNDPLKVEIHISEHNIEQVNTGDEAEVTVLATGRRFTGTVTSIAPRAEAGTRTYRADITLADGAPASSGGSATVRIPVGTVNAHRVSPAVLALDADGRLGVKTVTADQRVAFQSVEIVRSEPEGVWVTGLPEPTRLIVRGGGFVSPGEKVKVSRVDDADQGEAEVAE